MQAAFMSIGSLLLPFVPPLQVNHTNFTYFRDTDTTFGFYNSKYKRSKSKRDINDWSDQQ